MAAALKATLYRHVYVRTRCIAAFPRRRSAISRELPRRSLSSGRCASAADALSGWHRRLRRDTLCQQGGIGLSRPLHVDTQRVEAPRARARTFLSRLGEIQRGYYQLILRRAPLGLYLFPSPASALSIVSSRVRSYEFNISSTLYHFFFTPHAHKEGG